MLRKKKKKNTKILVYTNDIMFWTNNANELDENLIEWLNNIGNRFDLRINLEKTVI